MQITEEEKARPGILIGTELAQELYVDTGDMVHVINPVGGGIGMLGMPVPDVRTFRVAGIFDTGMYEYDTKWTYILLEQSQNFLQLKDQVNGIEIKIQDIDSAPSLAPKVQEALGYPFYMRNWKDLNQQLFAALKMEKIVMGLILSLIVMVASLNIVGTLILVVLTRGREISILRAMGASSKQILQAFMLEGLIIGFVGTVCGTILGLLGCYWLDSYEFPLDTDVYYMDTLPVVVEYPTVAIVMLSAVVISFVATIYPALVASRMNPVEGLRYE
jgi:lipoprotein-releasing system permease protein